MPGSHRARRRLPVGRNVVGRKAWVALSGTFVACLAGALFLGVGAGSADADGTAVNATFAVTGVSTSNCPVSAGGSAVYVKPGQELDIKSSLAGIYVAGQGQELNDLLGSIASLDGALVIDPDTNHPRTLDISTSVKKISDLSSGDHKFTWTVSKVHLVGGLLGNLLTLPLSLDSSAAKAGASLHYSGTIHVTSDAAHCGVAVQLPSTHISASVTGLPPVDVGLPGVNPPTISVPSIKVPVPGGGKTTGNGSHPSSGPTSSAASAGELPVPALIVPHGGGSGLIGGGGGYFPGALPNALAPVGGTPSLIPVSGGSSGAPAVTQNSTGKNKTIDLASTKSSTGQLSVVLAIIAVIVLSMVSAMYARLYLLRRD